LEAVSVATAINICHRTIIITNNRSIRATLPKYDIYRAHFRRQPSRTSLVYDFCSEYGNPSLTYETNPLPITYAFTNHFHLYLTITQGLIRITSYACMSVCIYIYDIHNFVHVTIIKHTLVSSAKRLSNSYVIYVFIRACSKT